MKNDLINKLKRSGLTQREAHVYLALLQKKEFSAAEISSIIPIGRTKIYEIIPGLVSVGFCKEVQKNGKKVYSAVEPKIAFKNVMTNYQQELNDIFQQKEQMLADKMNLVAELETELDTIYSKNADNSEAINYIDVIKDINQVKSKWLELQKKTKTELLAFNKAPYSIVHKKNAPHQKRMLKRKIRERGIFEYGSFKTKEELAEFIRVVDMYADLGEDCRVIKELPMKLVVIDEKITMLALNDPVSMTPSITTMIVTHPSFAKAQKQVFESYWNISMPLINFKKKNRSVLNK